MIFLDPKSDMAFKKLFGTETHKNLLISLRNSIMNNKGDNVVVDVLINNPTNTQDYPFEKLSIVDVRCTDFKGSQYILEIQVAAQDDYGARAQYYASLGLARQLKPGDRYGKLLPVTFIGILDFDLFKASHYLSGHAILDMETKNQELKHLNFYFLELKKFKKNIDQLETTLDKWIYFFQHAQDLQVVPKSFGDKEFKEAFFALEQGNWTPGEIQAYEKYLDSVRLYYGGIETAERNGMEKGKREMALAIARDLLDTLSIEEIARITGLSLTEIEALKK